MCEGLCEFLRVCGCVWGSVAGCRGVWGAVRVWSDLDRGLPRPPWFGASAAGAAGRSGGRRAGTAGLKSASCAAGTRPVSGAATGSGAGGGQLAVCGGCR